MRTRSNNYRSAEIAPPAKPPILLASQPLDASAYIAWKYDGADIDSVDGFRIEARISGKTDLVKAFDVPSPNTDVVCLDLANGTTYMMNIRAYNDGGNGPSITFYVTPAAPIIPAPKLLTVATGDASATITFTPPTLPDGYSIARYSWQATNTQTQSVIDGKVVDNVVGPLENDTPYEIRILAIATPGDHLSSLSNALAVTPTKPIAPYRPDILDCYAMAAGQIVVRWAPNDAPTNLLEGHTGPMDITGWQVRIEESSGKQATIVQDFDGAARTWTSPKNALGKYSITVRAKNDVDWSPYSIAAYAEYKPTQDPFSGGGTLYKDGTYGFIRVMASTTIERTDAGANWPCRVLLVGAGGGGHRQTLSGAKGGDGGGGSLRIMDLDPPGTAETLTFTIAQGATENSGRNPDVTTVKQGQWTYSVKSGSSATDKNDGAGAAKTEVPASWQDCPAFSWLTPGSHFIGGTAQSGEQNYPNATFMGEGGAGTKGSRAGNGEDGGAVLRWRLDGKPDTEPVVGDTSLDTRRRWRLWRR